MLKLDPTRSGPQLIQLPKVGAPEPAPMPPTPGTAGNPLDQLSGLLDQQVFGIPVKYIAIGLAAWMFLKKR